MPSTPGPYARAAGAYWAAGWAGILPLPEGQKYPPPSGWTGGEAPWPSYPDITAWLEDHPAGNLALRVPEHVLGIDVDDYAGKGGGATLAAAEAEYGPLPSSWSSSSRRGPGGTGDLVSGIRLFRIPSGLAWPGVLGPGIELIQYRHRYVVAPPSVHPDTGLVYGWARPDGTAAAGGEVPHVDDLPWLPADWVQGVHTGEAVDRPRIDMDDPGRASWLSAAGAGPECRAVTRAVEGYLGDLAAKRMARHDIAMNATARLTLLASEGHTGALAALKRFFPVWVAAVAPERDGGAPAARAEWGRLVDGAVELAAVRPAIQRAVDPCTSPLHGGRPLAGPVLPSGPPPRPSAPVGLPGLVPAPRGAEPPQGPGVTLTAPPVPFPAPVAPPGAFGAAPAPPAPPAPSAPPAPPALGPAELTMQPTAEPTDEQIAELRRRQFDQAVEHEVERRRIQDEAKRRLRLARNAAAPEAVALADLLATPDPVVSYRVEGLWTRRGRVMLTAAFKAGKSTLTQNVLRCLADGGLLLGKHEVHQVERRVTLIDDELDVDELRMWLREQNIVNVDKINVISLRGKVSTFDLTDDHVRAEWAKKLADAETDILILDCLRPVLDAIGLDEKTEAGVFLTYFDELLDDAGIGEALMVHHAGHEGERARGDSRLRDWPDQEWRIVRERGEGPDAGVIDPAAPRYFAAYGRRCEVPEGLLEYSESHRRLYYAGGSRAEKKIKFAEQAVIEALRRSRDPVTEVPLPLSGRAIEEYCVNKGEARNAIRKAIKALVTRRLIRTFEGPHRATLHELMPPGQANGPRGLLGGPEGQE